MNLDNLKKDLNDYLKGEGLKLYDLSYQKSEQILTVMLDESLDLNAIEEISSKISDFMDKHDSEFDNYILDVTTVGAERPIKNEDEVNKAIGSYVYVKTKEESLNGTLTDYKEGKLYLEYMDKTRKKQAVIDYKEVKQMRYAIKF